MSDPDALARDVKDAIQRSDLPIQRVSITVERGDVTVTGNGPMARDEWTTLAAHITRILDAGGFQYEHQDAWAFVEVHDSPDVQTDGGVAVADGSGDGSGGVPHSPLTEDVVELDHILMAAPRGEDGQYLAVWREADADGENVEQYHLMMDLANYVDMSPESALDGDPGGVRGENVTVDVWAPKPGGDGGE